MSCDYKLQITNYKPQVEHMSFQFWPYLSQILAEFLKSWTGIRGITISIRKYNIYKVLVIIVEIHMDYSYEKCYDKKPVQTSLFSVHGPIRTGPKGTGCGPPISWSVLDRLRLPVAPFGSQKLDRTGPLNTSLQRICWPYGQARKIEWKMVQGWWMHVKIACEDPAESNHLERSVLPDASVQRNQHTAEHRTRCRHASDSVGTLCILCQDHLLSVPVSGWWGIPLRCLQPSSVR
jgi:hypothetical protein